MPFGESGTVETTVMTSIFVRAPRNAPFDVGAIIAGIRAKYPNAVVIADDSFEAERSRFRGAIATAARNGADTAAALIEDSINRKEAATGPGTDLSIPIDDDHAATGYVRARSIRFHTGAHASSESVSRFVKLLETLTDEPVRIVART